MDRLRQLGYAVDATTGIAGGYRLAKGGSKLEQVLPERLIEEAPRLVVLLNLTSSSMRVDGGTSSPTTLVATTGEYRVDRLKRTQLAGVRFTPRKVPAKSYSEFVAQSISSATAQFEAVVVAHCRAEDLKEFGRYPNCTIEPDTDGRTSLTLRADSLDWLHAMVAMLAVGSEFEIQGPQAFIQSSLRVRDRLMRSVPGNATMSL